MQNIGPVNYVQQAAHQPVQQPYKTQALSPSSPQPNYGYYSPSLDAMAVQNSILTKAHPGINQKVPYEIFGQMTTMLGGKFYNKTDGSPFSGIVASSTSSGAQVEETMLEGHKVRNEIFENGRLKSTTEYDQSGQEMHTTYYKPDGKMDFMSYREKELGEIKFTTFDENKKD